MKSQTETFIFVALKVQSLTIGNEISDSFQSRLCDGRTPRELNRRELSKWRWRQRPTDELGQLPNFPTGGPFHSDDPSGWWARAHARCSMMNQVRAENITFRVYEKYTAEQGVQQLSTGCSCSGNWSVLSMFNGCSYFRWGSERREQETHKERERTHVSHLVRE
jgi:hypothetical protein